jgi:hypothetical protein
MSKEVTLILRNSSAENDRIRNRQLIAFAVLFLAMLAILLWIGHLAGQTSTDLRSLVLWSVIAMVVAVCYGMMALAIYINRTAARLLRTIERLSQQIAPPTSGV